jgi:hypothetical protein
MSLIGRVALGCVGPPGLLRFSVIVTGAFDPGRGCVSPPGFRAVNVGTVANGLKPRSAGRSSAYGGNPRLNSGEGRQSSEYALKKDG